MKDFITVMIFILSCISLYAQPQRLGNETEDQRTARMEQWTQDRFGMFIHWGIYALPARHEWVKTREQISEDDYRIFFELFNPDLFNPSEWAQKAKNAGMKYAVITTKHHDGFCLFDSKYTDYKATNTPIGRDLIREFVEAFREEGLGIGFYYSLIDWHHPYFTIDRLHPLRPTNLYPHHNQPKSSEEYDLLNQERDMNIYREYLFNQVRELLTDYGRIDILWLDYSYPGIAGKTRKDWDSENLLKMVRSIQPHIIINDRLDLKDYEDGWDFTTPEQYMPDKWPEWNGKRIPWETCQTFSGSWGYYRDEHTWKNNRQLLTLLIGSVSKGGNLLLNVGPTGRGTFDYRAVSALDSIGIWMQYNDRSIYGCTQAPEEYRVPEQTSLTYNHATNRLYIHLLEYPKQHIVLPNYKGKVRYAQFLHDASEIQMNVKNDKNLYLVLPADKPNIQIPVIELVLK